MMMQRIRFWRSLQNDYQFRVQELSTDQMLELAEYWNERRADTEEALIDIAYKIMSVAERVDDDAEDSILKVAPERAKKFYRNWVTFVEQEISGQEEYYMSDWDI